MVFSKAGSNYMENYVERGLTELHNTSEQSVKNYRLKVATFFIGLIVIVSLPYIHLGIILSVFFSMSCSSFYVNCI